MPQEARKEAERKLSRGVEAFYIIGEAAAGYGVIESMFRKGSYGRDFLGAVFFALLLGFEWKRWRNGERRRRMKQTPQRLPSSASKENWRPPGAPPPIG